MIRLLTAILILASAAVRADTQVPHTFEDGEVISATEFNQNFDTLETAIDNIPAGATGPQGPQGATGPQGPQGDTGPSGADTPASHSDDTGNTASGTAALYRNTTGANNTASGRSALYSNTTGSNNTAVGHSAGVASGNLENATAIGYNAEVNASNKVRIGNDAVTVIEGEVAWTYPSDARLKDRITPVSDGLALINDLNPVSYHRTNNPESDIEMGLLAQEVEATLEKHGLGNSGMVHQPNEDAYMSLRYNDLMAPMIRAIQELDTQHIAAIEEKDEQIALLEQKLETQQEELLAIVQSQQEHIAQLQHMMELQFAAR